MAPNAVYDSDQGEIVIEGSADEVTILKFNMAHE
jgi:hypothetical protein